MTGSVPIPMILMLILSLSEARALAQHRLLSDLTQRLRRATTRIGPVLFCGGRAPESKKPDLPLVRCDVTDWAILLLDEKTQAEELFELCPALSKTRKVSGEK